ncbi:MAG TPA: WYL domain-containing protein, partial [Thermoanaerobaculia bacterium]|nr:WYL domain-containing protein [Thermoanaerobaculia bacterium]
RLAVRERRLADLRYRDETGGETERTVHPLALSFYPPTWLLVAWCELRSDFRSFRLDRVLAHGIRTETFAHEPGRTLADFIARMEAEPDGHRRRGADPSSA